jgi:hypothetical protein
LDTQLEHSEKNPENKKRDKWQGLKIMDVNSADINLISEPLLPSS